MTDPDGSLTPPETTGFDLADPGYRAAVTDLLGALAYGELRAFSQLAADAELAPSLVQRSELAFLADQELGHYALLADRLRSLGVEPEQAMEPFVAPIDAFHERTRPSGWLEGLVKAYVGEGIAQDFYREIAAYVDADTRDLVIRVLDDNGRADFVVGAVRDAIAADPRVGGRLALWGRRLVGEALSQAQHVAVERDSLGALLIGAPGRPAADLAELGRMFVRLTDEHSRRMGRLGLAA
ncbi:MAG: ferritin-like domain-containing protein [Intrasporangium sp.]|uniref:ferritin-like fold-containing protein n=1 Tax=Intrasporangium sp. TaxID=1925024 RepID=UPI0026481299|nr:ferritin-like fold-containing protein [Intrasporangium sp.]MDN5795106.1 ferritin-like domain-containing protein [Intrasporangium sp.]